MRLEIIDDKNSKLVKSFKQNKILIGRSKEADLMIDGEGISRKHLYLECLNGKYFVTDLGSSNGVYVNEERVEANGRIEIQTFFPLRIGANTSISILSDEDELSTPIIQNSTFNSSSSRETSGQTMTKTLHKLGKNEKSEKSNNKKSQKKSDPVITILMFVLISIVSYFGYNKFIAEEEIVSNNEVAPSTNVSQDKQVKASKIYSALNPFKKLDLDMLQQIQQKKLCQSSLEQAICKQLTLLTESGEGAILEKENLYIFGDFKKSILADKANEAKQLKEKALIVLLANTGLTFFQDQDIKKNVEKIIFIHFKSKDENDYILEEVRVIKSLAEELNETVRSQFLKNALDSNDLSQYLITTRFFNSFVYATESEIP